MEINGITEYPDSLLKRAITEYRFSSASSIEDAITINQVKYADEHGEFRVTANKNHEENTLECTLTIEDENYTCNIPLSIDSLTSEVYPIGMVQFTNVELVSVSFETSFPWTTESFVASYWGEVEKESISGTDDTEWFTSVRVLQQYFPPRHVTSDSPDCAVVPGEISDDAEYMTVDVRNFTHAKTPNPWAYAATVVVYENEELAKTVFSHENSYYDTEKFTLTPPTELPGGPEYTGIDD